MNNIRFYRVLNKFSLEKFARECGFSIGALSYYENGKTDPSYKRCKIMANVLGVSVFDLMEKKVG